jgi:hypothetical protein
MAQQIFIHLQINGNRTVANVAANQVNVYNALNLQSGTFAATTNGKVALKSTAAGTAYLDNFTSGFNGKLLRQPDRRALCWQPSTRLSRHQLAGEHCYRG